MGSGSFSFGELKRRDNIRKSRGESAFYYSDRTLRDTPRDQLRVHKQLDPKGVTRESRDSANHPESLPIVVLFDVTGSMKQVPVLLQQKLGTLMGLLLQKGWAEHPQVLFGAIGDATCDQVPLQIGQFESDVAMENDLERFILEGCGGGQTTESYELGIFMASRHFSTDSVEKRNKKGYLFLIGDEMPYSKVKAREVERIIGDKIDEDIAIEEIIREVKEKFHIFMIRPANTSHGQSPSVQAKWVSLLGQESVIRLDYPEAVSEVIALTVGMTEGKVTLEEGIKEIRDLKEVNLPVGAVDSLARSLERVRVAPKTDRAALGGSTPTKPSSGKKRPGRI